MNRARRFSLALLAMLLSPLAANAGFIEVTLDFDSTPLGGFSSFTEDSFTITQFGLGDPQNVVDTGSGNRALVDGQTSNALGAASIITFSGSSSVTFDVVSLDIADLSGNSSGRGGTFGSGFRIEVGDTVFSPIRAAVFSPTGSSFTTFTPTVLTGLSSLAVNIVSLGPVDNFAVDNIVLRYRQVPEPGTLASLGIGLAGLSLARRRRKA